MQHPALMLPDSEEHPGGQLPWWGEGLMSFLKAASSTLQG